MNTIERQERIKQLYGEALERDATGRAAFLAEVCGDDFELRRELESLLGFEAEAANFIETPAVELAAELLAEEVAESKAGRLIGSYRILSKLGAGGMGEVWLAEDLRLKRKVALKLLPAPFIADTERVRRFEREARAASALNHPNILTIHEIGQTQDFGGSTHFIATEFVEGQTLRQRLQQAKLSVGEALDIAAQIASALAAAHAAGIVHRDIKPENVMLRPDGYVKVLDFGLARITQRSAGTDVSRAPTQSAQTDPGLILGTVGYMSPEQVRGEELDARTDIFSLGVVLYEMLAGSRPFKGATTADAIAALLEREPPPLSANLSEVPAQLQQIVSRALKKDRSARYPQCEELFNDLKSLREELSFEERLRSKGRQRVSSSQSSKKAFDYGLALKRNWVPLLILTGISVFAMIIGGNAYLRLLALSWEQKQLPLIEKMANEGRYFEAYGLAQQAKWHLPNNERLAKLMPVISDSISVISEPAGARVYLKRFTADEAAPRQLIGTTPISKLPIARGEYLMTVEKDGFVPFERTISSVLMLSGNAMVPPDDPSDFKIKLIEAAKSPDRMVFIPGGSYKLASRTRLTELSVKLDDYFMDKYEVTNREFKEFISAGGYFKPELWKQPFVKDGRRLTFDEAMQEFRDRTGLPGPRSWSGQNFPEGKADHPVTDITWHEAAAYAAFRGKQLPSVFQWEKAARNGLFIYNSGYALPWGAMEFGGTVVGHANFNSSGTVPVNSFPFGASPFGCYQMAGNVSEWCASEVTDGFTIAGGSWKDLFYVFTDFGVLPSFHSSDRIGFRCALNAPGAKGDQGPAKIDTTRQIPSYTPSSEASFQASLSHYRYDHLPLEPQIVETIETADWRREKITFLGGNDDRAIGYLYLPKTARPPFQVIQFVPAGDVYGNFNTMPESVEMQVAPFIKSGRAIWAVVFKGFKEREQPAGYISPRYATVKRREVVVANATDLSRGLDYLASRKDLDVNRLAFYGYSQGAQEGLIYSAVENRYRAAVFVAGGISPGSEDWIAEARPSDFASHIRAPKLLLNGRYDEVSPLRTHVEPLFKLLREPKRMQLYDAGHTPPLEIIVPAINGWLDETLGKVVR
ncbi:MAG: SUMF1/EgtB/PvdO family nonheme iron enzyme [Acidobacteria bacterium]|nr:SUMF1/EgtB/PvdO family nonheme iron enzyme [Acidobacteriota bacterium]